MIIRAAPDLRAIAVARRHGRWRDSRCAGSRRPRNVIVVSGDGIPEALEAVKGAHSLAPVAQFPDAMAYPAFEAMIKVLKEEPVPATT